MESDERTGASAAGLPGRERTVAALAEAVAAPDGPAAAVLMRGEAGVGKSHALARIAALVQARGHHVLRLVAGRLDAAAPYSALARAVAGFAPPRSAIEPSERLADALAVPGPDPAAVRAAGAECLAALRAHAPTLVAVDDLDLLDDATVALVDDALRREARHPLVLLGALRPGAPAPGSARHELVVSAARAGRLRSVDLAPLDENDVAALVGAPDTAGAAQIHDACAGNPFLALAAASELAAGHAPADETARAVLDRMVDGGPETRRVAAALALIAPAPLARVGLAAQLADVDEATAAAVFDRLVERALVTVAHDARYAFRHPVLRACLVESCGPARRRRWHALAAERLAALPPSAALDAERAGHLRHVAQPGDEAALDVLARVAERAARLDAGSAIAWYEAALAIAPPEHPAHAHLTAQLVRALFIAGRPREAADLGRSALARLPADGPRRERLAGLVLDALGQVSAAEAAALLDAERAVGALSERLGSRAAHAYAVAGRLAEAEQEAARSRRALTRVSPAERVNALADLLHTRSITQGYAALDSMLAELRAAAADAPPAAQLRAYAAMSLRLAVNGETSACAEALERARELSDAVGGDRRNGELALAEAFHAVNTGDWDLALTTVRATAERIGAAGGESYLTVLRAIEIELLANRGEWAAARRLAERPVPDHPTFAAIHVAAQGELDLLGGDLTRARRRLEDALRRDHLPWPLRTPLLSRLADVEVEAGDLAAARRVLSEIELHDPHELDRGSVARLRLAEGRASMRLAPLREALAIADEHGLALLRGRARLHLAQQGDDPEANLRAAMRAFQALEATPWRRRTAAELRSRGLKVPRRRARGDGMLTEAETQIARLVQQGRSNGEIALTVSLSVKTVQAYLTRIYGKTGCANRLELARALDGGLLNAGDAEHRPPTTA